MSWHNGPVGAPAIGSPVIGGTADRILFIDAGPILAHDDHIRWDDDGAPGGFGTLILNSPSATTGKIINSNGELTNTTSETAGFFASVLATPANGGTGINTGMSGDVSSKSSGDVRSILGLRGVASVNGTCDVDHQVTGLDGSIYLFGTGDANAVVACSIGIGHYNAVDSPNIVFLNVYGDYWSSDVVTHTQVRGMSLYPVDGFGNGKTITTYIGVEIGGPGYDFSGTPGTITNTRGLVVYSQTTSGLTQTNQPFGILQEGADDRNSFAGKCGFGTETPKSKIHIEGASGWIIADEQDANPTTSELDADDAIAIYTKADKFVIAYNNGGTMTYITLDLDGSDITWAHSTSAP